MIVRLKGFLTELSVDAAILERDGLAYEVLAPVYAIAELATSVGREITLHTFEYLEGNAAGGAIFPRLIGFLRPEDRAFFRQFITVKGIGVRKALRALAEPVGRVASFIENGNASLLAKLPGIGKRTADQIVAELKGKVTGFGSAAAVGIVATSVGDYTPEQRSAIEIIVAWGDSRTDAQRWITTAAEREKDLDSPEEWVTAAYRVRGK